MKLRDNVRNCAAYVVLALALLVTGKPLHAQTTVEYIHTDALGTPVAVTDASGNVIQRSEYAPYGELLNRPVTDGPGYTGHVADQTTGLTYMQQRYYDPVIGAMLSTDPVTAYEQPITNFCRYCYARNNPYKFTDPDGRQVVGSPNDFAHPITIEQSAQVISWAADGLDAVDQMAMALPQGQLEHAAVGPIVLGLKGLASEAKVASSAVQAVKLEKALASEAQTARVLVGEGEAIAGAGTKAILRDADRLAAQHGGEAADWAKVSGGNKVARDGTKIETHAYENVKTGQVVEPKTKLRDEGQ